MLPSPEYLHLSPDVYSGLIKLHCYQPPRTLVLPGEKPIFDLRGHGAGVNEMIFEQCYGALTGSISQEGFEQAPPSVINHQALDVHFLPSLTAWLKEYHPETWLTIRQKITDCSLPTIGSWHLILPLLPRAAQELVVDQALNDAKLDLGWNTPPSSLGFWLPESAIDTQTVEVLASRGITHVFLRRDQVEAAGFAPYVTVQTSSGKLTGIIYESEASGMLAFGDARVENYLDYLKGFKQEHGFWPLAAIDGETYGHHSGERLFFLNWLLNYAWRDLPADFNQQTGREMTKIVPAKIVDSTSWSCPHQLGRWNGSNRCRCDGADEAYNQQKRHLYDGLISHLNGLIDSPRFLEKKEAFVSWFSDQRPRLAMGKPIMPFGGNEIEDRWGQSLATALIGLTSCGWFFGPQNSSNVMMKIPKNCLAFLEETAE